MTFAAARREIQGIRREIQREFVWAIDRSITATLTEARRQSSGTMSYSQMRQDDHPFAKRHGSPRAPLMPINRHTGVFYDAWFASRPRTSDSGQLIAGRVVNDSPVAEFLKFGTRTMFARGIEPTLNRFLQTTAEREFAYGLRRLERQYG